MSYELQRGRRYDMPVSFGSSVAPPVTAGLEVLSASVSFISEREALAALLPRWFEVAETPTVSVTWQQLIGVDWMGGRDYNIVAVYAAATHPKSGVSGPFGLAVWESDTAPIISGREYMGTPKLYGQIPADLDPAGPELSFDCAEYGHVLLEADLSELVPYPEEEMEAVTAAGRDRVSFNWKHIPGCGGTPDADYPVQNSVTYPWDRAWRGQGEARFLAPDDRQAPYSGRIARTLGELPVRQWLPSFAGHCADARINRELSKRIDV